MLNFVEIDESRDLGMASKRYKKQNKKVIELSPDWEEATKIEVDIGIPGSCYHTI